MVKRRGRGEENRACYDCRFHETCFEINIYIWILEPLLFTSKKRKRSHDTPPPQTMDTGDVFTPCYIERGAAAVSFVFPTFTYALVDRLPSFNKPLRFRPYFFVSSFKRGLEVSCVKRTNI